MNEGIVLRIESIKELLTSLYQSLEDEHMGSGFDSLDDDIAKYPEMAELLGSIAINP